MKKVSIVLMIVAFILCGCSSFEVYEDAASDECFVGTCDDSMM